MMQSIVWGRPPHHWRRELTEAEGWVLVVIVTAAVAVALLYAPPSRSGAVPPGSVAVAAEAEIRQRALVAEGMLECVRQWAPAPGDEDRGDDVAQLRAACGIRPDQGSK